MTKSKNIASPHYFTNNYKIPDDSIHFAPLTKSTTTKNSGVKFKFNKSTTNVWIHSTLWNRCSGKENKNNTNCKRSCVLNCDHRFDNPISLKNHNLPYVINHHTKSINKKSVKHLRHFSNNKIFYLQKCDVCINFKI